ncbi:hypothetical protein LCGC14_2591620 [marine sediment metagenome]|uniref:Uncharacterized protein n=1 Tax=marine sediment metagenome TaxID=412755 RepID=A0A0F9D463_9ZZZZ
MPKQTVRVAKQAAWAVFARYIRLRDCLKTTDSQEYGECVSCDRTLPYSELDAGHFIPKKSGNYFSERGVNAQCQKCNRFLGGNQLPYRREIIKRYGEGVDLELEEEARQSVRFTTRGLNELRGYYQKQVAGLEGQ